MVCGLIAAACWQAQGQGVENRRMTAKPVVAEVRPVPPEMTRRFAALQPRLQPSARAWVEQQARLEAQKSAPDVAGLEAAIRSRFLPANPGSNPNLAGSDIEAVAFLVMMQATNAMDKDLQQIMAEVQAMTDAKQKLRDLMNQLNKGVATGTGKPDAPCLTPLCRSLASELRELATATAGLGHPVRLQAPANPTYANLRTLQGPLQQNLDSMNEMSEMTSLRLQMAMDRRSKFVETLSNIMKKLSDTSESIVQNMK
jgi:hypothetical protein